MNVRHLATRTAGPSRPGPPSPPPRAPAPPGSSFADALRRAQEGAPRPLTLSAHAEQRIEQRAISLTPPQQEAMSEAVATLDAKGARDALLLRSDAAFVVNVPNRTVVTALAADDLTARVFTGIDSALVL
ncbi:TIGR02530 family flagellar biosynthesis protein [Rubrivirga litoralis]|uniref:TIGR02530 family flagellar biosynthesis protein n=1 Tax=Rubrivirga litoralis TaxID=3075598 RepID=A0ABU3BSU9_9BACT|nr:TIGR02530 family flagellar biosynthesis protein [Rubrivirga sp. F394]MDT0632368.1 TIGR02530 family flagellar biosynthesis protein [Rubrivirga sp. F394]